MIARISFTLLLLCSLVGMSNTFRSIVPGENATIEFEVPEQKVIEIHLTLQNNFPLNDTLHLALYYVVNEDTIVDYMNVAESHRGKVKSLKLEKGDQFKAYLTHRYESDLTIEDVKGNLTKSEGMMEFNNSTDNIYYFSGNVWVSGEKPLFRIEQNDSIKKGIRFEVSLNENFEYDSLHVMFKVISPSHGEMKFIKSVEVNSGDFISGKPTNVYFDLKGLDVFKSGNYYFELKSPVEPRFLNGVVYVNYLLYPVE